MSGLQEQVGPRIDVELVADRAADRRDPPHLQLERVKPLSADHLVLEVAPDRARCREPRDVRRAFLRIGE